MKVIQITDVLNAAVIEKHLDSSLDFEYKRAKEKEEIVKVAKEADILISIYENIDRQVLDQLPNLKFIAMGSIGYNFVDVAYAREKNIYVANNPIYCVEEVADHTLGLIIDRCRRISDFNASIKNEHKWEYNAFGNSLSRLSSKKVALIGLGKIGRAVAKRLKGFGVKVLAYDPYIKKSVFKEEGVEEVSLKEIQEQADIISLHLPLTEETHHMIDETFIRGCKKAIILINTARGSVVDEGIYEKGLRENLFLGLGLDVLESEDPDLRKLCFIQDERLVITPHSAFYSRESDFAADYDVAKHINLYVEGKMDEIPIVNKEIV